MTVDLLEAKSVRGKIVLNVDYHAILIQSLNSSLGKTRLKRDLKDE